MTDLRYLIDFARIPSSSDLAGIATIPVKAA